MMRSLSNVRTDGMGQVVPSMATAYGERVSDERLRAVCELVRVWLFGKAKKREPR
jgi:hypothetical protein